MTLGRIALGFSLAGFGLVKPKHGLPGLDVAGVIDAVGEGVSRLKVGDAVYGELKRGSFADFVVGPEALLAKMPAGLSFAEAAAMPTSGMTAREAVREHGRVAAGERVLVIGATGGVGRFALQIAVADARERLSTRGRHRGDRHLHVANKDAILDGIVDLMVGEIGVPDQELPWRAAMEERCRGAREVLLAHRWLAGLLISRAHVGPNMLRYIDGTIGALRRAGFSIAMVDQAWGILDSHVYGFVLQELDFPIDQDEYADTAAAYLPTLDAEALPHLTEMTRAVAERRHDGGRDFELGLRLVLDGLEGLLKA